MTPDQDPAHHTLGHSQPHGGALSAAPAERDWTHAFVCQTARGLDVIAQFLPQSPFVANLGISDISSRSDVIGVGRVLRRGRSRTNCEAEIVDPCGTLIAKAIASTSSADSSPPYRSSYPATSLSLPVATSKTKPRSDVCLATNGLPSIRRNDCRTSSAGSGKASAAHVGLIPVFVLDGTLEVVIGESEHPAVGVVNQDDLASSQQPLTDRQ